MNIGWYLAVSAIIFCIGAGGVLVRRNPLVILLCLELMLNAANLALVAFARMWGCLLYTSPSPRDRTRSRMPSSA